MHNVSVRHCADAKAGARGDAGTKRMCLMLYYLIIHCGKHLLYSDKGLPKVLVTLQLPVQHQGAACMHLSQLQSSGKQNVHHCFMHRGKEK